MAGSNHIAAGVFTALIPVILRLLARPSRELPTKGLLVYPRSWRGLAVCLCLLPLIVFDVIVLTREWTMSDVLVLGGTFGGLTVVTGLPIAIEVFRASYIFDGEGIQVRSPWSRQRTIKWCDVTRVRWRNTMKWLDISTKDSVVHISPLLLNLEELAQMCRRHIPDHLLDNEDVDVVVRFMGMGRASELAFAAVRPSQMR